MLPASIAVVVEGGEVWTGQDGFGRWDNAKSECKLIEKSQL